VDFDFPIDLTLPPGGLALLVNFDPSTQPDIAVAFRAKYEVPQTVPLWGPYQGNLNNAGERVSLLRPDAPQTAPGPEFGRVPYILVDQVRYSNLAPWPTGASGTGFSIQRSPVGAYGDDPAFWQAAAPTAGRTLTGAADSDGDGMPDDWEVANGLSPTDGTGVNGPDGDLDQDGMSNGDEYQAGTAANDPASVLALSLVERTAAGTDLSFGAASARTYTLLVAEGVNGPWLRLLDFPASASARTIQFTDPTSNHTRFYKLITPALP
ncbi:MAG: hypothetical protein ACYDC1_22975, partial [Limisphaerales bacterium]